MGMVLSFFKVKKKFHYSGEFAIYLQAIPFLADYINDDVYYGSSYEKQIFIEQKIKLYC
jgi:hypothetical protein